MSHRFPSTRSTRLGIAGVAFAAASLLAVPVASATTPTGGASQADRVTHARTRCEKVLDRQEARLTKDVSVVKKATGAPEADRVALTGQLESAHTTLAEAKKSLASADTLKDVRKVCEDALRNTRVAALDGPKVRAVVATSRLAKIDAHATKAQARFEKMIARAEKRGVAADKVADAKAKAADVKTLLADAHHNIDGLASTLLPITPAQVNDHSAKATLESAKSRMTAARTDAKKIRGDIKAIVEDLRPTHR